MSRIKLIYFDFPGGRGEDCRLALHVAGVEFEDERVVFKDWPALKPETPYGSLPVLEIEGAGTLAQSNAILGLIGTRFGLLPEDDFQAARHRAILNAVEDLSAQIARTNDSEDEDRKKKLRQELAQDYMKTWAQNVEKQIEGPFVAGSRISVADLKLYILVNWIKKGLDHIPKDYFDSYPCLSGLFDAVAAHPKVIDWYAARAAAVS